MPTDAEAPPLRARADGIFDALVAQFRDRLALLADEELRLMRMGGFMAADIGVARSETVDKALLHEEVEGAIDRDRSLTAATGPQPFQNVIRPNGSVARPHDLQHAAADIRQAHATRPADRIGARERIGDTSAVIVGRKLGRPFRHGC